MKTKTHRDRVRTTRLRDRFEKFEPLEQRALFDGNVNAFVSGGSALYQG